MADRDFEEEEVWSCVGERKGAKDHSFFSASSSSKRLSSASRAVPRAKPNAEENVSPGNRRQCSAPVNIPDWSKIYGSNASAFRAAEIDDADEAEDEEADQVPPHEWLAKRLARTQISSFSVCEGEGRTLKGRDQRKVRNAVLAKTGFLE